MKNSKKPFYTRPKFFIILFLTLGLLILLLIPLGLSQRSVGGQLLDAAEQFTELYVYDEKEHWDDEEWDKYWSDHPEYLADTSGIDWESHTDGYTLDDPRLDEIPPDYSKLWNIDFSNLETTQQYNFLLDELTLDKEGKPITEEFIYREKTTGDQIIDVTLDGFILKLNSDYRASWKTRSDSDPNGFNKFKKALNLSLAKDIGGKLCYVEIAPYDWSGSYQDEKLNHELYNLTMRYSPGLHTPENPTRFLQVKLNETPYNTDVYAIEINPSSPNECFEANLELEILNAMQFLPPELKRQGINYDELNKFPIPYYWPKSLHEAVKISEDETSNKKIVEYDGFSIEIDPNWLVKYHNTTVEDQEYTSLGITQSRRCAVGISDITKDYQKFNANSMEEYYKLKDQDMDEKDMGILGVNTMIEKISDPHYEIYKTETTLDLGGDFIVHGSYIIEHNERLVQIIWIIDNRFEDVRPGDCGDFGEAIFESFSFLE